jgi:erythromycin esterase
VLHDFLRAHASSEFDLPPWDTIDRLLGPDEPWNDPAAAMEPARSIGAEARVHDLRATTDHLRWTLTGETLACATRSAPMTSRTPSSPVAPPQACSAITSPWHETPTTAGNASPPSATR